MEYTHEHKRNWGLGFERLNSMLFDVALKLDYLRPDDYHYYTKRDIYSHQLKRLSSLMHSYTFNVRYGFDYGKKKPYNH